MLVINLNQIEIQCTYNHCKRNLKYSILRIVFEKNSNQMVFRIRKFQILYPSPHVIHKNFTQFVSSISADYSIYNVHIIIGHRWLFCVLYFSYLSPLLAGQ